MSSLDLRLRVRVDRPPAAERDYVLYWMTAARRPGWNHALERALYWARSLNRPLVIFEPLRAGYRWASDRHHRFVIDGMADNARAFAERAVTYLPYLEPAPGEGRGLLAALSRRAAVVVGDETPMFFLPRMLAAAEAQVDCRFETVDTCGLMPLAQSPRAWPTAYSFRRACQKLLPAHFDDWPLADCLEGVALPRLAALPEAITGRWPMATAMRGASALDGASHIERTLAIDHSVAPVATIGGHVAGTARLAAFIDDGRLARYGEDRNKPGVPGASGLSPYLHFGHVSPHQVFEAVAAREQWSPDRVALTTSGSRAGWWGMSAPAEAFLDQVVTWREVGYQFCHAEPRYAEFETLPDWARATLEAHASDPRPEQYSHRELQAALTGDRLWNAAQNELRRDGVMHNYLRMLWGKKILEWTASPQEALEVMIAQNDKWAIDGRDPNSYTGIMWVLGRFDRPWGPERPIFGKVRYMTSASTRRKYDVADYIAEYAGAEPGSEAGSEAGAEFRLENG